jgi:hypothetical protein
MIQQVIASILHGLLISLIVGSILIVFMNYFTAGSSDFFKNIIAIIIWLFALGYGTFRGIRYWKNSNSKDLF